jgi:hypothetical protein
LKPLVRVADAGRKGKGIFASAAIKKSSTIATFRGKPKWVWEIPVEVLPYTIQVDYDRYVVPKRGGTIWYMNHSCEPNCGITGNRIVAERDIANGEELTFDYSSDVDWPGFRMKCSCGCTTCRKVIRAYRFLSIALKLRYGRHVAPFILRRYFRKTKATRLGLAEPAARRAVLR